MPEADITGSAPLLELIALELAHAHMESAEKPTSEDRLRLDAFEEAIEEKQAQLNLLPIKRKIERLGIRMRFFYKDQFSDWHNPDSKITEELESKVWQDTRLLATLSGMVNKSDTINVVRQLPPSTIGQTPSASMYTDPEYNVF